MKPLFLNSWFLASIWLVLGYGSFYAWRYFSRMAYEQSIRFRFYSLRDRCVDLIAKLVILRIEGDGRK